MSAIHKNKEFGGPTAEFYYFLCDAFDHFNSVLFSNKLPRCLITVQREKNSMGYFSPNRWGNKQGKKAHEIAINPAYFANHKVVEIFQTLVHEQCHLWQHEYGQKKSRSGYHNAEWADKMESIGLMPSSTGDTDGLRTGQKMGDYPIPDGLFIQAARDLVTKNSSLSWVDRLPATRPPSQGRDNTSVVCCSKVSANSSLERLVIEVIPGIEEIEVVHEKKYRKNKSKAKFQCPACKTNVWGVSTLKLVCGKCGEKYTLMDKFQ